MNNRRLKPTRHGCCKLVLALAFTSVFCATADDGTENPALYSKDDVYESFMMRQTHEQGIPLHDAKIALLLGVLETEAPLKNPENSMSVLSAILDQMPLERRTTKKINLVRQRIIEVLPKLTTTPKSMNSMRVIYWSEFLGCQEAFFWTMSPDGSRKSDFDQIANPPYRFVVDALLVPLVHVATPYDLDKFKKIAYDVYEPNPVRCLAHQGILRIQLKKRIMGKDFDDDLDEAKHAPKMATILLEGLISNGDGWHAYEHPLGDDPQMLPTRKHDWALESEARCVILRELGLPALPTLKKEYLRLKPSTKIRDQYKLLAVAEIINGIAEDAKIANHVKLDTSATRKVIEAYEAKKQKAYEEIQAEYEAMKAEYEKKVKALEIFPDQKDK